MARVERLDGLRAVAILGVFLHHYGVFSQGWIGVELFFVLSGYLITGILRADRAKPTFWRDFYAKRAARILPPIFLLIFVVFPIAENRLPGWRMMLANVFFLSNFVSAFTFKTPGPLVPLWSLSIEEHFYLLWPLAVRKLERRQLMRLACGLLVLEPLLRLALAHRVFWLSMYMLTPVRLDGLLLGSLLALLLEEASATATVRRVAAYGFWAASGTYTALCVFRSSFLRESASRLYAALGYSLIALGAFFLIGYVVTHREGWLAAMLGSAPFRLAGMISFGLYLFQIAVRDFLDRRLNIPPAARSSVFLDVGITILVSTASYKLLENPIRRGARDYLHRSPDDALVVREVEAESVS